MTRRRARRARSGWLRRVANLLLLSLSALVLAAAAGWFAWQHETTSVKLEAGAPPMRLYVPQGASADSIGRDLHVMRLTRHPAVFRWLARTRGVSGRLKAGDYALHGPLSLEGVLGMLVRGDVVHRTVTIPEGRTRAEIAEIVAAQGLDAEEFRDASDDPAVVRDLDPDAEDLEGYLFPDTYDLPQTPDAARQLVLRMTQRFREVVTPHLPSLAEKRLTVRHVVTVASIVELETGRAEERPRIAAVFLNRLQKGMLLQTDPTIIYALKKAGRWDGNITRADLQMESPYNTYRHAGLPPGPIGCPGRDALLAVLAPAATRDLYFVSRNDGSHEFNETLQAHNRAVDRYQRRRASS